MINIPSVSQTAVKEAYGEMMKLASIADEEEIKNHLIKHRNKFYTRQPEIARLVSELCENHDEAAQGNIANIQFVMYVMAIVNSFYIQEEIDDVKKLFDNEGENND